MSIPGDPNDKSEKTRLCPTCRMEISVLATKCRFCGEIVGRPRDEVRALTIDDLGGETIRHYAPSSSVMEAMEAFRAESEFQSNPPPEAEPQKRTLFGAKGKKDEFDSSSGIETHGLPQLDERSQALASLAMPTAKPRTTIQTRNQGPGWVKRAAVIGGACAAIMILYFGSVQVMAYINRPVEEPKPQFVNPAVSMLKNPNADPVAILEEAVKAQQKEDLTPNREATEKARELVVAKIDGLLMTDNWTEAKLQEASDAVNRAFKADSNPAIRELKEQVDRDLTAYRMHLERIEGETATFRLNRGNEVKVEVGKLIKDGDEDRFLVSLVKKDYVQVIDQSRKNRQLTYRLGEEKPTSP